MDGRGGVRGDARSHFVGSSVAPGFSREPLRVPLT